MNKNLTGFGISVAAVAVALGMLLVLSMLGARIPTATVATGICLHQVVVFSDADSLGVVWSDPPCNDNINLLNPAHWQLVHTAIAQVPRRCAIVFRLPGFDAPIVDTTLASPACTRPNPTMQPLQYRKAIEVDR